LKVVTHHLGALFPFFSRRVEVNARMYLGSSLRKPISEYWRNIYGDTAVDGTRAAYACGYEFFGQDRMLFGTDYPYGLEEGEDFIRENLAGICEMTVSDEIREKILSGNARKLLKIA
jgi:predicted TIM-barrel fold metal-dependent hydrolase